MVNNNSKKALFVDHPDLTKEVVISSDSRLKVNKELCKLFADYGWEIEMSILPNILAAYMELIFLLSARIRKYDISFKEAKKEDNRFFDVTEVYKSYYDDLELCKSAYIAKASDDASMPMSMEEKINNIANELGFEWLLSMDETVDFLKDITLVLFEFGKKINTFTHEAGLDIPNYDFVVVHLTNNKVKLPVAKYHIRYEYDGGDPFCFIAKLKEK